jgi:hypothetical protein
MQDRRHQVTAANFPRHPERLDPPSLISARQAQPVRLGSRHGRQAGQAYWRLQENAIAAVVVLCDSRIASSANKPMWAL